MEKYKVYVEIDADSHIIWIGSSAIVAKTDTMIQIDEGDGLRYKHAQTQYLVGGICTDTGAYRYKLVNSSPIECTTEEIAEQEAANQPEPVLSPEERIAALETGKADQTAVDDLNEALNMILEGVTE